MGKIDKKFRYAGERTIIQSGNSLVVSLPPHILKEAGVEKGKTVYVYSDSKTKVLIELRPDKDVE